MKQSRKEVVIKVNKLNKVYSIYDNAYQIVKHLFFGKKPRKEFQALKDISFEISKGQVVGVVGRNGSGKSTLLKILAGTLSKTSGNVEISGKVIAILELGTGFDPEYTGRENIYFSGVSRGISKTQIESRIDEIIDFSELRDVIDQPFKTYSSGMQARLTFSAALLSTTPDIFIIDEALSTGDSLFQKKCFMEVERLIKEGVTVFFVTHDMSAILQYCNSAILLSKGEVIKLGDPKEIEHAYNEILYKAENKGISGNVLSTKKNDLVDDGRKAKVLSLELYDDKGIPIKKMLTNEYYTVKVKIYSFQEVDVVFGISFENIKNITICGFNSFYRKKIFSMGAKEYLEVSVRFKCLLSQGSYSLVGGVSSYKEGKVFAEHILNDSLYVNVESTPFLGFFDMNPEILHE
ncbi:ABC transporter ATP-binding protein [Francisella sp. 19X1-34]|uniref:ABC transporter ATP-binding protein n=1 Tax=Francisella sp. 19X1-34 TaxID=3087177 RepID=UPI002E2EEC56|nr:ABC transporter ATP-binding protein [Francisella sp. 19X1-34]MED7787551.1 ABC transporter ATP-binding protein [Francisella sp. 19X1-34]